MDSNDIRSRLIEEELRSVWPGWHVVRRLGGGSFGDVFQIYRDNYGIRVDSALKVIQMDDWMATVALPSNSRDESSPDIPEALRSEIQIMEALRGAPNIVSIEDFAYKRVGQTSTLLVRMELLKSLQEVLPGRNGQGTLSSISEITKLGKDVCRALMYCEKRGIIHRDIKPANLFVDRFGDYKVGDFGASKRMETVHVAQTMTGIGTISYMAPEIFRGQSYNNTVDIYALGLVLYQLLNNGRMAFLPDSGAYSTQDIDSANYHRLHGTPVPSLAGKYVGGERIDSRLDAVVRKACAMNPADRYRTAKEFFDALVLTEMPEKKAEPEYGRSAQSTPRQAVPVQERQEYRKSEPEIKSQSGAAAASNVQGRQQERYERKISGGAAASGSAYEWVQERKHARAEAGQSAAPRQAAAPQPARSSDSQTQKRGLTGVNKYVLAVIFVFLIVVVALALNVPRSGTGSSAGADQGEVAQTGETVRGTISDSWEEIIAAGKDGTYINKYQIGDTKELDLGEEGVIRMELVALDADELADGSGNAHMTWVAKDLLRTRRAMDSEYMDGDGWPESDMRAWLQDSILPLIPGTVRSNIKEVTKYSYSFSKRDTIPSVDMIWIPSRREVFGKSDSNETIGPKYTTAFTDDESRTKIYKGLSSWWWLRSTSYESAYNFIKVSNDGSSWDFSRADFKYGVAIGFCF